MRRRRRRRRSRRREGGGLLVKIKLRILRTLQQSIKPSPDSLGVGRGPGLQVIPCDFAKEDPEVCMHGCWYCPQDLGLFGLLVTSKRLAGQ